MNNLFQQIKRILAVLRTDFIQIYFASDAEFNPHPVAEVQVCKKCLQAYTRVTSPAQRQSWMQPFGHCMSTTCSCREVHNHPLSFARHFQEYVDQDEQLKYVSVLVAAARVRLFALKCTKPKQAWPDSFWVVQSDLEDVQREALARLMEGLICRPFSNA